MANTASTSYAEPAKKGLEAREIPYCFVPRESGESVAAIRMWGCFRRDIRYVVVLLQLRLEPSRGL